MVVMERAKGMILLSTILLYLENSVRPQMEGMEGYHSTIGGMQNIVGGILSKQCRTALFGYSSSFNGALSEHIIQTIQAGL